MKNVFKFLFYFLLIFQLFCCNQSSESLMCTVTFMVDDQVYGKPVEIRDVNTVPDGWNMVPVTE